LATHGDNVPTPWYAISNADEVPSPALLVYPERVEENIRRMIAVAGGVDRLRPHMKTSKIPEVVRMHVDQGISRYKVATIAEAEMAAEAGAPDVLLAYQPVGPNIDRFVRLIAAFPRTVFSALVDDEQNARLVSQAATAAGVLAPLFLDLDIGMHRSGIDASPAAGALYRLLTELPGIRAAGLHAYDGHIHDTDRALRQRRCEEGFALVRRLREQLAAQGVAVPTVVAGGTPTFPFHAERPDVECSPGTTVFWDLNYTTNLPDLEFLPAVMLLTRVISKPGPNRICVDLGHKAVASENPHPRAAFMDVPDAHAIGHSEEHLPLETRHAGRLNVGSALYAMPWHVCPTVALHNEAVVVREGRATDRWKVVARARRITI
jgi:D-serine deaminase-like pyridoxal phosphate-dependent protein